MEYFVKCFPIIKINDKFKDIPAEVMTVIVGILGENRVENWLNSELETLEYSEGIDLLK